MGLIPALEKQQRIAIDGGPTLCAPLKDGAVIP
jgi:hypothetical protein